MDTAPAGQAARLFQRSRRPLTALPLAFMVATLFAVSPTFASTGASIAPATPSGSGYSTAPGMYPSDPSAASARIDGDPGAAELPADLCGPSGGGYSTAPGMSPDTSGPTEGAQAR